MNTASAGIEGEPIRGARRVEDSFSEVVARGSLSRDRFTQKLYLGVADRLRRAADAAEIVGAQAIDYRKPSGGGGGAPINCHDSGLGARERYRATCAAVGEDAWPYVEAVVLHNLGLVTAGQQIAGVKSRNVAADNARCALVEGLERLVAHWHLAPMKHSTGIQSVRQDGGRIVEHNGGKNTRKSRN